MFQRIMLAWDGSEVALRAFQKSHGLVPDGIAGPKTWAAIDAIAVPQAA